MLKRRFQHIRKAFTKVPNRQDWFWCTGIFAGFMALALPVGFATGFFRVGLLPGPGWMFAALPVIIFLKPCLFEETFYRGLLLPHPEENHSRQRIVWYAAISLVAFILSHPLNGLTLRPDALPLFFNPVFLFLATLLGAACTLVYLKSGSIWPGILIHWVTDVVWVLFLSAKRLQHIPLSH